MATLWNANQSALCVVRDGYRVGKAREPGSGGENVPPARSIRKRWLTMYSTNWCGDCHRSKAHLKQRGIAYDEIDIDGNADAARQVEAWNNGNRSVPTIVARIISTEASATELQSLLRAPEAILTSCKAYVTGWCSHSRSTLAWLRAHGITAEVIDIEADPAAAQLVEEWNRGSRSVPTLELRLRITEPTNDELDRFLGLAGW